MQRRFGIGDGNEDTTSTSGFGGEGGFAPGFAPGFLVEPQGGFVLTAGEKHDFIAILFPCRLQREAEEGCGVAVLAEIRAGDHILNQTVGPGGAGEIRDDSQSAGGDQLACDVRNKVEQVRVAGNLLPEGIQIRSERKLGIFRMEVTV